MNRAEHRHRVALIAQQLLYDELHEIALKEQPLMVANATKCLQEAGYDEAHIYRVVAGIGGLHLGATRC